MSDPDQDKGFLARWSQRKSLAQTPEPDVAIVDVPAVAAPEAEPNPEFDLASLPRLEDMTSTTDITGFLRKGVPEQLRNAALRQSWALDPAIRNYVSPALEYAYDWNTPGGVPGNSELAAGTDVAKMILQIMGNGGADADGKAEPAVAAAPAEPEGGPHVLEVEVPDVESDVTASSVRLSDAEPAMQDDPDKSGEPAPREGDAPLLQRGEIAAPQQALRRHGGAKPLI